MLWKLLLLLLLLPLPLMLPVLSLLPLLLMLPVLSVLPLLLLLLPGSEAAGGRPCSNQRHAEWQRTWQLASGLS